MDIVNLVIGIVSTLSILQMIYNWVQGHLPSQKLKTLDDNMQSTSDLFRNKTEEGLLTDSVTKEVEDQLYRFVIHEYYIGTKLLMNLQHSVSARRAKSQSSLCYDIQAAITWMDLWGIRETLYAVSRNAGDPCSYLGKFNLYFDPIMLR